MTSMLGSPLTSPSVLWTAACISVLFLTGCNPEDPSEIGSNNGGTNTSVNTSSTVATLPTSTTTQTATGAPTTVTPTGGNDMGQTSMVDMNTIVPLPDGEDVSVATFNVELLFDETCNSGRCASGDFEAVVPRVNLNTRFDRIEKALRKMDADVVVLQEIETEELFNELAQKLKDKYPNSLFGETNFAASLDIGILAKGNLLGTQKHRQGGLDGDNSKFAREFLEIRVDLGVKTLVVFGAHFLSKRTQDTPRRLAEARTAGRLAKEAAAKYPEALVVVAGDLNDTPDSQTLKNLQSEGLIVPALDVPASQFYTHTFSGMPQIIDHVLYIEAPDVRLHQPPMEVFRDNGRDGFGGSDHSAVRAKFRIVK